MTISKTTLTGVLSAVTAALTMLAGLTNELDSLPPEWKHTAIKIGIVATLLLRIIKSVQTADAKPTP